MDIIDTSLSNADSEQQHTRHSIRDTRQPARSSVRLPIFGFGAAPLGGMMSETAATAAYEAIEHAWTLGVRYFDTAPQYGNGLAEHRVGHVLRDKPRGEWLLSSKVGRLLRPRRPGVQPSSLWCNALPFDVEFDYSYDATMRSLEDSFQRLGMDSIDLVLIHDVSIKWQGLQVARRFKEAMAGAHKALVQLRDEGLIKAIGAGLNDNDTATRFVEEGDLNFVMIAGRYTLLDLTANDHLLPACLRRQVGLVMAGPYNSGILASGSENAAAFHYKAPPQEILDKVRAIEAIGQRHNVTLQSAALQFPLTHPAVTSIVCGLRTKEEVEQAVSWLQQPVSQAFWREISDRGIAPVHGF
jgi:D-threo-aldose 1-dehydrogenase